MTPQSGQMLSHYRLVEKIGAGGQGVVWRAEDTVLSRTVAIKVLPADVSRDEKRRRMFLEEARAASAVGDAHIVQVYEFGHEGDLDFIVMEHVDGKPLTQLIRGRPMPPEEVARIGNQVARALARAHRQALLHRDLKPANILVTSDGEVKVVDFGLAALFIRRDTTLATDVRADATTQTHTRGEQRPIAGTLAYMSPEQTRGEKLDARSDIFSLGVVLYEMITGRPPFMGATVAELTAEIQRARPRPIRELLTSVPPEFDRIVKKALAARPGERYQTMDDLAVDLKQLGRDLQSDSSSAYEDHKGRRSRKGRWVVAGAIGLAVTAAIVAWVLWPRPVPTERPMIVVLPFENLGRPEDEYFADGMSDEITARLARLTGLGVIARTSAMQYKDTDKSIRDIGEELGVHYVLEGTIRWEHLPDGSSRVRVTPQLVRTADATHLWASVYEEPLAGVFGVQSKVAERVAEAMNLTLLEPERRTLREEPTADLEAYDYYLRGEEYFWRASRKEGLEIAQRMYERAIEHDSGFALAQVRLSQSHSLIYWFRYDRTTERLAKAKAAVDRALALDPDLPEAHLALGFYHYWGYLDYDRALAEFQIAGRAMPGSWEVHEGIAYVRRRQGRWHEAIEHLTEAVRLNPRSPTLNDGLGETYALVRDYPDAQGYLERAISLNPDEGPHVVLARVCLAQDGATRRARAVLDEAMRLSGVSPEIANEQLILDLLDRDFQGLLDRLETLAEKEGEMTRYSRTLFSPALFRAFACTGMGRLDLARTHYDSARLFLEREIDERPDDELLAGPLGIAYAGLGRREEAIRAGQRAVGLRPIERDALNGTHRVEELARIYAMIGEHDAAIDALETLLSRPGFLSTALLRLDPVWDPLRDHPRFKKLLEENSN